MDEAEIYKQDIDDNCPMTGDDTDTDTNAFVDDTIALQLSDGDSSFVNSGIKRNPTEILPMKEQELNSYPDVHEFSPPIEDEEESLSSDRNCFSDEETSSVAESFDDLGKDDLEDSSTSEMIPENLREEKLRRIALRKHLDQLGELVVEREYAVHQARDELLKCREYLEHLEEEMKNVSNQMKEAEQKGQKASYFRLKSNYEKLMTEINIEKEVDGKCLQNLEDAEFYLAQTYIEHGKFLPLDEELEEEEKQSEKLKVEKANARIKKEVATALAIERRKKKSEKEHISSVRERERKNRQAVIAAKKNREVAMKYLKDTMSRIRQRESEEEDKTRADLTKRMNALLSLKRNIEFNKENMSALQARDNHIEKKESASEQAERGKLEALGENPDEVLTRRKRIRQFERDKEAFERKQREREIEIVNKIISEEKQMKRRYQQQPQLWPDNRPRRIQRRRSKPQFAPSSGSESMEYGADVEDTGGKLSYINKQSTDEEGEFSPYGATNRDDDEDKETTEEDDVDKEDDENLAEPEFKGLWEQSEVAERKTKNWKTTTHEYSKYEQEMMKNALLKQKQNIVQKQVATGREFKGVAFYSKPETVTFKDFEVGKTYNMKVLLTNVSYTQNYCQYVGLTDKLKDFIDVSFVPPGPMSAGLTCDLTVTFKPMINEDLEGRIEMMAQTGIFYIPIRCLKKRCDVQVDTTDLDFENQVVGETRKKAITLKNCGALPTNFEFTKISKDDDRQMNGDVLGIGDSASSDANVEDTPTADSEEDNDIDDSMRTGKVISGVLAPFSAVQLDVIFMPMKPNNVESDFKITFSDPNVDTITISAKGTAIDLPVWVERENIDLRICMYDRLYQDAVIISNRATSALRIRFEVPKELRNHLDILPKTAFIQAESQFSAQLKFLPRKSLSSDAENFHEVDSGKLTVPIAIRVADQTQPVPFSITATVTSSDLEFDVSEINMGDCTLYETVLKSFKLINKSVLPQQYGFVGTPDVIDIQPNDGFGTILPNEHLDLDILFSPDKAREYKMDLICKSEIGREFVLRCRGVGVLPPLKLSDSVVKFPATAVEDMSTAHFFVKNEHTSANEFTHPVPRVGSGEIFPVGPTSFQFIVPDDASVNISPTVGTVLPGQQAMVYIIFSPKLDPVSVKKKTEELVQLEDVKSLHEGSDNGSDSQAGKISQKAVLRQKRQSVTSANNSEDSKQKPKAKSRAAKHAPQVDLNKQESHKKAAYKVDAQKRAQLLLKKSFENTFSRYKIPCFIAYGECGDPGTIQFNPSYTLYLEVHCPTIKPLLIAASENGDNLLEFGKVSIGQKRILVVSLQNISETTITLTSKSLDPIGPFCMVNALRPIEPGAIFPLKIEFCPEDSKEFYETLELLVGNTTTPVRIKGQGVKSEIALEPSGSFLDVGDALVMDTMTSPLKITNISELPMEFTLTLGSLSPQKHNRMQNISLYLDDGRELADDSFHIGTANISGMCVFGCKPCQAKLEPGESKDIEVSFSPDHPSELYRDELFINVNGAEEFMRVHLVARGWPTMTYARGWDRLTPKEEGLADTYSEQVDDHDGKPPEKTVLLTFHSVLSDSVFSTAERAIELGCIRSTTQLKKSCDYGLELTKEAKDLGFSVDPSKGGVDIGAKKSLLFTWDPPPNYDPQNVAKTTVQLTMRGDIQSAYNIMLRGFVKN